MMKWLKLELGQPVQVLIPSQDPIVRVIWPAKDTQDVSVADYGKI